MHPKRSNVSRMEEDKFFEHCHHFLCILKPIHISENQNHEIQSPFHHLEGNTVFLGGSHGKESACSARDLCSIPESVRTPGKGNSSPLQYSCLENSMDRGAWQAIVHGVSESDMTEATEPSSSLFRV